MHDIQVTVASGKWFRVVANSGLQMGKAIVILWEVQFWIMTSGPFSFFLESDFGPLLKPWIHVLNTNVIILRDFFNWWDATHHCFYFPWFFGIKYVYLKLWFGKFFLYILIPSRILVFSLWDFVEFKNCCVALSHYVNIMQNVLWMWMRTSPSHFVVIR